MFTILEILFAYNAHIALKVDLFCTNVQVTLKSPLLKSAKKKLQNIKQEVNLQRKMELVINNVGNKVG
jgi:hypothetical protein